MVPLALLQNMRHNQVLHQRNLILTVVTEDVPYADRARGASVEDLGCGFHRVALHYGYMEAIDVPRALEHLVVGERPLGRNLNYFLSRETIRPRRWLWSGMAFWRERLFASMSRNAVDATGWFRIPPTRVMEVGTQIEI